jgi:tetratricopeptide (TPR) repeat protein
MFSPAVRTAALALVMLPAPSPAAAQAPAPASPPAAASGDADALFARGVQNHQAGDLVGAIEAYQAALELQPDRVDARSNLGAAYARLGRHDEAIQHYRAVLERVPEQSQVRLNLALALYKSARIAEAAAELERVVAAEPGQRQAVLLLADCRAQMGDDAAVVALLGSRDEEFKDDRLYAYLLGNAHLRRNELLKAQGYIERLFRGQETAEARLLMGVAHLRRGDFRAALPELEKAARLNPDLPTVHSLLGRALMGMTRRDDAMREFRRELEKNPNDFDANVYVGLFLKDDGKLDEAHEYLKRAGRLRSRSPAALFALGSLHLAAGRVDEAQQALASVTAQLPEYQQAHVLLANAYYRQKKKDLGDRHRDIAETLRARQQAREPGASDELGPAYRGGEAAPPAATPPPGARP